MAEFHITTLTNSGTSGQVNKFSTPGFAKKWSFIVLRKKYIEEAFKVACKRAICLAQWESPSRLIAQMFIADARGEVKPVFPDRGIF